MYFANGITVGGKSNQSDSVYISKVFSAAIWLYLQVFFYHELFLLAKFFLDYGTND